MRLCGRRCSVDEQWYERGDVGGEKTGIWGRVGEVMGAMFVFKQWGGRGWARPRRYVRLPDGRCMVHTEEAVSYWGPECPRNPCLAFNAPP